jgi:hypothetical protein
LFDEDETKQGREGIDWEELFLARRDTNSAVFLFLFQHPIPIIIPIPISPIIIPIFLISY